MRNKGHSFKVVKWCVYQRLVLLYDFLWCCVITVCIVFSELNLYAYENAHCSLRGGLVTATISNWVGLITKRMVTGYNNSTTVFVVSDAGKYRPPSPTSCNGTGARSVLRKPITTQRNKYRQHSSTAGQR